MTKVIFLVLPKFGVIN